MLMLGCWPPFVWDTLLALLQIYAVDGVKMVGADSYAYTTTVDHGSIRHIGWLYARNVSRRHAMVLTLSSSLLYVIPPVLVRIRRLFDPDCRPDLADTHLGTLTTETPSLRVPGAVSSFEVAVRAIAGQIISLAQTWRIPPRITAVYDVPLQQSHEGLLVAFPSMVALASISMQTLSTQTGLQASRATAAVKLTHTIDCGRLRLEFLVSLTPTLAALQALPGVGEWTAQYVAIWALNQPGVFPLGDYILRKRLADADGTLPRRRVMIERAEPWAPWHAYAAIRLWHREIAFPQPTSHRRIDRHVPPYLCVPARRSAFDRH